MEWADANGPDCTRRAMRSRAGHSSVIAKWRRGIATISVVTGMKRTGERSEAFAPTLLRAHDLDDVEEARGF